ncbi:unnamed protein product [Heterobilharzia americana]|nr:unnamed protein product [Heterobilharzia americana]
MSVTIVRITSRAGLQYEGALHSVDDKHCTVTLKKVRLCNMPVTDCTLPKNIDYVIFRSSDIDDVQLSSATHVDPMILNDSAIVSVIHADDSDDSSENAFLKHDPSIVKFQRTNLSSNHMSLTDPKSSAELDTNEGDRNKPVCRFDREVNYQQTSSEKPIYPNSEMITSVNLVNKKNKSKSLDRNVNLFQQLQSSGCRHFSLERHAINRSSQRTLDSVQPSVIMKHGNRKEVDNKHKDILRRPFFDNFSSEPIKKEKQLGNNKFLLSANPVHHSSNQDFPYHLSGERGEGRFTRLPLYNHSIRGRVRGGNLYDVPPFVRHVNPSYSYITPVMSSRDYSKIAYPHTVSDNCRNCFIRYSKAHC